jgi:hypothetical protein
MMHIPLCRLSIALILSVAPSVLAQTTPPEAKATGAIKGRVTANDGKGLEGVAVVLLPSDFTPDRKPPRAHDRCGR